MNSKFGSSAKTRLLVIIAFLYVSTFPVQNTWAEQFFMAGSTKVHYIVLNTLFLKPEIAKQYGIARGNEQAIANISLISKDGVALRGIVQGRVKNLLGQIQTLRFREIVEKDAVYYIAPIIYTNRDILSFEIEVALPNEPLTNFEFQERMYLDSDR